jgi:hypothetical protein
MVEEIAEHYTRVGKAVTLAHCDLLDGDQVAAIQVGVYGLARPSIVTVKPQVTAPPRRIDEINEMRFQPERSPPFLQHFAHRWALGARPFSGTRSNSICFIRHRDPSPLTESHIVALVDCIPTPALSMLTAPAPASSLVWNLEFFEHEFGFGPEEWWRIDTDIDAATEGYVNQTGLLQDPQGQPVALSRQVQDLEADIATLQDKLAVLDRALADPDLYASEPRKAADFAQLRTRLAADLDRAESRWLEAQESLSDA